MKKNMGSLDQIIRLIGAIIIIGLLLSKTIAISSTLGIILMIVGGILVATAWTSSCPLYSLFGLSTCPVKTTEK